jgi:hypothetical protein
MVVVAPAATRVAPAASVGLGHGDAVADAGGLLRQLRGVGGDVVDDVALGDGGVAAAVDALDGDSSATPSNLTVVGRTGCRPCPRR